MPKTPPKAATKTPAAKTPALWITGDPKADKLLASDPLALLLGMVLDQQIPMERAFAGPARLAERMGVKKLNAEAIAGMDPAAFALIASTSPAVHRFPGSMAARMQKVCSIIATDYAGKADRVWNEATTGDDLVKRLSDLPGFGQHKAKMFTALLGKQFGVTPKGWREASAPYGAAGTSMSVADVTSTKALQAIRAFKQAQKAKAKAQP